MVDGPEVGGRPFGGGGTVDPLWVEAVGWVFPLVVGPRAVCLLDDFLLFFGTTDPLGGGSVAPLDGGDMVNDFWWFLEPLCIDVLYEL